MDAFLERAAHRSAIDSSDAALRLAIDSSDASAIEVALKAGNAAASDAALLREGVLKLATLTRKCEVSVPPAVAPKPAASSGTDLRLWLLESAGLDARIVDKTVATLAAEEVFVIADLSLLRTLPQFKQCLTAVTRKKIVKALGDGDGPPLSPVGGVADAADDVVPDWLLEASSVLEGRPQTTVHTSAEANVATTRPPRRRSQSFRKRGERADRPERTAQGGPPAVNVVADGNTQGGAPLSAAPDVCQHFLRGRCHFGAKCRQRHPDGAEGSVLVCFECGGHGHKRRDCPTLGGCMPINGVGGGATTTTPPLSVGDTPPRRSVQRRSASFQTSRERRTAPPKPLAPLPAEAKVDVKAAPVASVAPVASAALRAAGASALEGGPPPPTTNLTAPNPTAAPVARSASFRRRQQRRVAAERNQAAGASAVAVQ